MEVDEELLRDGVIELPLFITTALKPIIKNRQDRCRLTGSWWTH